MNILQKTDTQLIINTGADVMTVPNTPYSWIKYDSYNGNRIIYKLNNNMRIEETYNNGIFNCTINDSTLQFYDRETIAQIIQLHQKTKDVKKFEEFFLTKYEEKFKVGYISQILYDVKDRLSFEDGAIVIDNIYKVDKHAQAWVIGVNNDTSEPFWSELCIVAEFAKAEEIETNVGTVKVNQTTNQILDKIEFLLNPNIKDTIFMNQIARINQQLYKKLMRR